jgi:hypothetical protein
MHGAQHIIINSIPPMQQLDPLLVVTTVVVLRPQLGHSPHASSSVTAQIEPATQCNIAISKWAMYSAVKASVKKQQGSSTRGIV